MALAKSSKTPAATATQPAKVERKEATIYVGPSLPNGMLAKYTVFKEGNLLPQVNDLIKELPSLKTLIVPVSKLGDVERKLKDSSSLESSRFSDVFKHFRKGVK